MEEMNSEFRPEVHVAHKSRRDKLRLQQDHGLLPSYSNRAHTLMENIHGDDRSSGAVNNFSQGGDQNTRYGPSSQPYSDYMEAFPSINSQTASENKNVLDPTFAHHFSGPQHFSSTWKSIGQQSSRIRMGENNNNHHSQIFPPCEHSLPGSSSSPLQGIINSSNSNTQNSAIEMLASVPSSIVRTYGLQFETDDRSAGPRQQVNWILGPAYDDSSQWNNSRLASNHDNVNANNATQGLCLTLSSAPPMPKVHSIDQESPSAVNIPSNISQQVNNNPGPLGPFTGYATILESSKFLRPTQQLLDEICCITRPANLDMSYDVSDPRMIFEESSVSNNDVELASSSPLDGYGLENRRKKAKLICMQEEVCKRYKHYHQQMQMVLSSFESVTALSAATPYISLALKTVSKHFRHLKNAIANKLKTLKNNALGEDHHSSSSAAKGQQQYHGSSSSSMMKFHEQSFQKAKSFGAMENNNNHHVWRPQRGLPEHAVSVLRAWLFDHFLHPYPTDTDKHMLAAQTGLTRNQVSNWFINARVRVWKPMVEEVHMLETEAMSETVGRSNNNPIRPNEQQPIPERNNPNNRSLINRPTNIISDAPNNNPPPINDDSNAWKTLEKRSRMEYDDSHYHHHHHHNRNIQQGVNFDFDGSTVLASGGFDVGGFDMGGLGLGSVSLTLGLRQSAENGQRQIEHRMRPFS